MNKKITLASLSNIANKLDNLGHFQYANDVTNVMKKLAAEKYEFFVIEKIKDKFKILVRNAGEDYKPLPGTFEDEEAALKKAKSVAYQNLTDKKPITEKDRKESEPAREKIRQILKNK